MNSFVGLQPKDVWLAEIERYYQLRGWDPQTGIPTSAKLEDLGLHDESEALRPLREAAGMSDRRGESKSTHQMG